MTRLNCFVSEKQHEDLRLLAAQKRKSVGAVIREILAFRHEETGEKVPAGEAEEEA